MKENIYRSVYCGNVDKSYVGKEIKLAGWVNSIRNLGSLLFITLRDETGIVQLISEEVDKYIKKSLVNIEEIQTELESIRKESKEKNKDTKELEDRYKKLKEKINMMQSLWTHQVTAEGLTARYGSWRNAQTILSRSPQRCFPTILSSFL